MGSRITLSQHKQVIGVPFRLNNFDINISRDFDNRLQKQLLSVGLDLKKFDVRQVKLGNRMYPYFVGRKEDAFQFTIQFTESSDQYVERFFQLYEDKLYDESGLVKMRYMNDVLMDVKIYQLNQKGDRTATYMFSKCLFIEDTTLNYDQGSSDIKILSFTVYARRFRKFFGKQVGYENLREAQKSTSLVNTALNEIPLDQSNVKETTPGHKLTDLIPKKYRGNIPYLGPYISD